MQILTFPWQGTQLLSYSMPSNFWGHHLIIKKNKKKSVWCVYIYLKYINEKKIFVIYIYIYIYIYICVYVYVCVCVCFAILVRTRCPHKDSKA